MWRSPAGGVTINGVELQLEMCWREIYLRPPNAARPAEMGVYDSWALEQLRASLEMVSVSELHYASR